METPKSFRFLRQKTGSVGDTAGSSNRNVWNTNQEWGNFHEDIVFHTTIIAQYTYNAKHKIKKIHTSSR